MAIQKNQSIQTQSSNNESNDLSKEIKDLVSTLQTTAESIKEVLPQQVVQLPNNPGDVRLSYSIQISTQSGVVVNHVGSTDLSGLVLPAMLPEAPRNMETVWKTVVYRPVKAQFDYLVQNAILAGETPTETSREDVSKGLMDSYLSDM